MTIFLHNCTNQNITFYYRVDYTPEGRQPTMADRKNFKQVSMAPWGPAVIRCETVSHSELIGQIQNAGGVDEQAVPRALGGVTPFLYREGAKVGLTARDAAVLHNRGVKTSEGNKRRQDAAIASNEKVVQALREVGVPEAAMPQTFDVEYEQDVATEDDRTGKRLTEGFHVEPGRGAPAGGKRGAGRGRGAAA